MVAELKSKRNDLEYELIPSSGGVFEVNYDGKLVFSKKETDRFPDRGEVAARIG